MEARPISMLLKLPPDVHFELQRRRIERRVSTADILTEIIRKELKDKGRLEENDHEEIK